MSIRTEFSLSTGQRIGLTLDPDNRIKIEKKSDDGTWNTIGNVPVEMVPHMVKFIDNTAGLPSYSDIADKFTGAASAALGAAGEGLAAAGKWLSGFSGARK